MDGRSLPILKTAVPGPKSTKWVETLANTECPAITARRARRAEVGGVSQDPIVWEAACGANVQDVDGNVYVDLTAAFAVAGLGHTHPRVVAAATAQATNLIHAMGDVYPARVKIELAQRLADLAPGDLEVSIFGLSGSEAVEGALKTAAMATGKSTVIAFQGAYHGLSYGALAVTGYRAEFRAPFRGQLGAFGKHMPFAHCFRCPIGRSYPDCGVACLQLVRHALDDPGSGVDDVAAVIVEPIQGRGGIVVPPDEWLVGLADICRERDILLIFDEIFTGMGRTGRWFACEHAGVTPDILCLGKSLGGGFPISAVIGSRRVMESWGLSSGEAVHTSTFLGNPLGCAMSLAAVRALEEERLIERCGRLEGTLKAGLHELASKHRCIGDIRGRGTMIGVELVEDFETKRPASKLTSRVTRLLLERGYLVLPSGVLGNVIGITPPFTITEKQLHGFFATLDEALAQ